VPSKTSSAGGGLLRIAFRSGIKVTEEAPPLAVGRALIRSLLSKLGRSTTMSDASDIVPHFRLFSAENRELREHKFSLKFVRRGKLLNLPRNIKPNLEMTI
jgi:hypothetical protein